MSNQVVLITGAATGLGRITALNLAEEGYRLALVDFNEEAGQATAEEARGKGAEVVFVKANVASEEDVKNYVEETVKAFGQINYFVNNAGIMVPYRALHEYSLDEWDRIMNVNLKGAFLGIKYVIPELIKAGGGTIVNTVSSNSFKPTYHNGVYSISKHGVLGITKSIGQDYQDDKVYAVGVAPNNMLTNISAQAAETMDDALMQKIIATTPPNEAATPEEVSQAVIFALKNGKLLNGSTINCAGGQIFG